MANFGETLKQLRKEKRITLRDLAEQTGLDYTGISRIENGILPPPNDEKICKLAKALDTDVDKLILLAGRIPENKQKKLLRDNLFLTIVKRLPLLTKEQRKKFSQEVSEKIGGASS